jgi:V/A-type H+-transporting ATPase subunit E
MSDKAALASSGVEALIEQLRDQGVKHGQEQAAKLVEEAEHRADWLLSQAKQEAELIVAKAKKEAEQLRSAGEEALKIAARDMNLEVKEGLTNRFTNQVERLVTEQLDSIEFLQRMILELVSKTRAEVSLDEASAIEMLLPKEFIGLDELRRNPHEYREGKMSHLVQSLTADQLREGLTIALHDGKGIKVRLIGKEVEVDLSDEAIARLLLKHLQPRFRALLDGVIR